MRLNRWYQSLADREKILVALGGSGALILLLLLLVWRPLTASNQQLQTQISSKTNQLAAMQHAAELIKSYRQTSPGQVGTGSLQQRVTHTAGSLRVSLTRMQSNNEQTLQLWIDRVEFNSLLKLIDQLAQQGVGLDKLNLQPLPDSGYSKARLTLVES